MKFKKISLLLGASLLMAMPVMAGSVWQRMEGTLAPVHGTRVIVPEKYVLFNAAESALRAMLANVSDDPAQAMTIALPMPDGLFRSFRVWANHTMAPGLAARYTDIKTYTGVAVGAEAVTAKIDLTLKG